MHPLTFRLVRSQRVYDGILNGSIESRTLTVWVKATCTTVMQWTRLPYLAFARFAFHLSLLSIVMPAIGAS